jgi:hypothetical protein
MAREQPEEADVGHHRLYGKGVPHGQYPTHTERWTYDDLFPPEDET